MYTEASSHPCAPVSYLCYRSYQTNASLPTILGRGPHRGLAEISGHSPAKFQLSRELKECLSSLSQIVLNLGEMRASFVSDGIKYLVFFRNGEQSRDDMARFSI